MIDKELQNSDSENEILSAEDLKLRQMLGDLKKVDAPKNFDFHLKAKIANANPADFQTASLIPFLRYLLPFSVVVLLAVFVGFNLMLNVDRSSETVSAPPVAPVVVPSAITTNTSVATTNFSVSATTAQPILAVANEKTVGAANSVKKVPNFGQTVARNEVIETLPTVRAEEEKIQDKDIASRASNIITPPGIPSAFPTLNNSNTDTPKTENTAKQFLEFIGINAVHESAGWKVVSVRENNMAFRAGVKVDDVIEAIDNIRLTNEKINTQIIGAKVLHIVRDGKKIMLEMNK